MGKARSKTGLTGKAEQMIRLHPDTLQQFPEHALKVLFGSEVGSHGTGRLKGRPFRSKSNGRSSEDRLQWSEEEDHYDGFGGEDDYSDTETFVGLLIPETKLKEEVRERDGVVFLPPPPEQFKDGQEDVFVLPPPPQFQDDGDESAPTPTLGIKNGQERTQTENLKRSRDSLDEDSVSERKKNKPLRCKQCWKKVETPEELEKHLITHEPWMRPYQCSKCGGRFLTSSTVKRHIRMKHRHNATYTYSEWKSPEDVKDEGINGMASCSRSVQGQNSKVDEDEIEILKEKQRLEKMGYYDFLAREVMNSLVETVELLELYSGYDGGDKKDEKKEELQQRVPDITPSMVDITKKEVICEEEKHEQIENEEEKSISIEDELINFREVFTSVSQDVGIGSEGEARESALLEQHHNQSYFIEEKNECGQEILEENQDRYIPEAEEALALVRQQNAELVKVKEGGEVILVGQEETHPVNVKNDEGVEDLEKTEEAITLACRQNEDLLRMEEDSEVILVDKEKTDSLKKDERVEDDLQIAEEVLALAWRQNTELLRLKDWKEDVEAERKETPDFTKDERVTFRMQTDDARNSSPPCRFRNEDKIRQRLFEDQGNHSLRFGSAKSESFTLKTRINQGKSSMPPLPPYLRDVDEQRQRTLAPGDPRSSSFHLFCRKNDEIRGRTHVDRDNNSFTPPIASIEERRPRISQDQRVSTTPPLLLNTEGMRLITPDLDDPRNFSVPHYLDKADLPPRTPDHPRNFSIPHFRDDADLPPRTPEDPRKFSIPHFRETADLPSRTPEDPRIFRDELIPRAPTNREGNSIPPLLTREELRLTPPQALRNSSSLYSEKKSYPKSPIPAHLRNKDKMRRIRPRASDDRGLLYTSPHRRKTNESRLRSPDSDFPRNSSIPQHFRDKEEIRPGTSDNRDVSSTPPNPREINESRSRNPDADFYRNSYFPQHFRDIEETKQRTLAPGDPRKSSYYRKNNEIGQRTHVNLDSDAIPPAIGSVEERRPKTSQDGRVSATPPLLLDTEGVRLVTPDLDDPRNSSSSVPLHYLDKADLPPRTPEDSMNFPIPHFREKANLPTKTSEDPRIFKEKADLPPRTPEDPRIFKEKADLLPRTPEDPRIFSIPHFREKADIPPRTPEDPRIFSIPHFREKADLPPRTPEDTRIFKEKADLPPRTPEDPRIFKEKADLPPRSPEDPRIFRDEDEIIPRPPTNREGDSIPPLLSNEDLRLITPQAPGNFSSFLFGKRLNPKRFIPTQLRNKMKIRQRTFDNRGMSSTPPHSREINESRSRSPKPDFPRNSSIPQHFKTRAEVKSRTSENRDISSSPPHSKEINESRSRSPNPDFPRNSSIPQQHFRNNEEREDDIRPGTSDNRDMSASPPHSREVKDSRSSPNPDFLRNYPISQHFKDNEGRKSRTSDNSDISSSPPHSREINESRSRSPNPNFPRNSSIPQQHFRDKDELKPRTDNRDMSASPPRSREINESRSRSPKPDFPRVSFIPQHFKDKEIRPRSSDNRDMSSTPPHSRKNKSRSRSPHPEFPRNSSIPQHFRDKEERKQRTDDLSSSIPPLFKDMVEVKPRSSNDRKKFVIPPPARSIQIERRESPERPRKHVSPSKSHRHYRNDLHRSKREDHDRRDDDEMVKVKVEVRRGWSRGRGGISYSRHSSSRHNPHPSDYRHKSHAPHSSGSSSGRHRSPESRRGRDKKSRSRSPSSSTPRLNGGREKLSYICRVCSKVFNHPSPLKLHMKGHVDDSRSRRNDLPHHHHPHLMKR